jgi:hypothetical protein
MNNDAKEDNRCYETPVEDLLQGIPNDARFWVETSTSSHHFPIGVLAKKAIQKIQSQQQELEAMRARVGEIVSVSKTAKNLVYQAKLCSINNMSSRQEMLRLMDQATELLGGSVMSEAAREILAKWKSQRVGELENSNLSDESIFRLARRCLWLAYVWNDRNFKAAHHEARAEAERLGITTFEQANDWIEKWAPPQEQPQPDVAIIWPQTSKPYQSSCRYTCAYCGKPYESPLGFMPESKRPDAIVCSLQCRDRYVKEQPQELKK